MKINEIREHTPEELVELETKLRGQLVQLNIAKATQRITNTSQVSLLRRDIARVKTVMRELELATPQPGKPEQVASTTEAST